MSALIDLMGQKFGRLTVIKDVGRNFNGNIWATAKEQANNRRPAKKRKAAAA